MASQITREQYRAVARIFYAANQRHARLAAEQAEERENQRRGDADA